MMNKRGHSSLLAGAVALAMFIPLAACGGGSSQSGGQAPSAAASSGPVAITLYWANDETTTYGKLTNSWIKKFQDQYKDQITLTVENTPNLDEMVQKVKMMYASGETPDLVQSGNYDLSSLGAVGDKVCDLMPYLNADPTLKSYFSDADISFNTHDGKLLSVGITMYAAMFYNKTLFAQAGITPAATWDQFWSNCDKLKAAGITPMCMDVKDTAWITNLLLGAMVGSASDAGRAFMNAFHPTDYNTPEMIGALTQIQKCYQQYAQSNASTADYNAAAASFLSGKAAMIFNGPWMIASLSDPTLATPGLAPQIGVCLYPEATAYAAGSTGWVVGKTTKAKEDACVQFIKFWQAPDASKEFAIAGGGIPEAAGVTFTDAEKAQNPLLVETSDLIHASKIQISDFQSHWYLNVSNEMTVLYPQLIFNKITPADFARKLTDTAKQNAS